MRPVAFLLNTARVGDRVRFGHLGHADLVDERRAEQRRHLASLAGLDPAIVAALG